MPPWLRRLALLARRQQCPVPAVTGTLPHRLTDEPGANSRPSAAGHFNGCAIPMIPATFILETVPLASREMDSSAGTSSIERTARRRNLDRGPAFAPAHSAQLWSGFRTTVILCAQFLESPPKRHHNLSLASLPTPPPAHPVRRVDHLLRLVLSRLHRRSHTPTHLLRERGQSRRQEWGGVRWSSLAVLHRPADLYNPSRGSKAGLPRARGV